MTSESIDGVVIEAADGVLQISLDRPKRKNALDVAAIARIVDAFERAATDESLRAILVRSTGDDFCAGADWVATNRSRSATLRPALCSRSARASKGSGQGIG